MMQPDIRGFGALVGQSFLAPAATARILIGLGLSRAVLWQAMLLVTVLSVLLVAITQGAMPNVPPPANGAPPREMTPFSYGLILGGSLVLLVFALHFTGQALGGIGDFGAALTLVVWLEVLAMMIRLGQSAVMLLLPALGGMVSVLGLGLLFWVLLNFINVLHGFDSLWKSAFALLLAVVGISLGVTLILTLIGVGATGGRLDV
jgi:hypothetical protein